MAANNHPNRSRKINLSYRDYREAVEEAFAENISNPSLYWSPADGFYAAPSSDLIPNTDYCLGRAHHNLNNDGARSPAGTRAEYRPIAAGIRTFFSTPEKQRRPLRDYVFEEQCAAEYVVEC